MVTTVRLRTLLLCTMIAVSTGGIMVCQVLILVHHHNTRIDFGNSGAILKIVELQVVPRSWWKMQGWWTWK